MKVPARATSTPPLHRAGVSMSEPVTLRRGNADHDQIMSIWREASRVGHPFLSEEDLGAQEKLIREQHLPVADFVFAERDGVIVGFIATRGNHIGALFVAPEAHGSGVGRRLVEDAQARNVTLQLGVYEANHLARAFYDRLGFVQIGRDDHDDEGRPLPLLRLAWKRLGAAGEAVPQPARREPSSGCADGPG